MNWTTTPPKEPGWWWVDAPGIRTHVIYLHLDGTIWTHGIPQLPQYRYSQEGWRWAGPIPLPQEQDD